MKEEIRPFEIESKIAIRPIGHDLRKAAEMAIEFAQRKRSTVLLNFNEQYILVEPDSKPEIIFELYAEYSKSYNKVMKEWKDEK
jgi:hypothetical protein